MKRGEKILLLTAGVLLLLAAVLRFAFMGARFGAALCTAAAGALVLWVLLCRWAVRSVTGERCRAMLLACVCAGAVAFVGLEGAIINHALAPGDTPADAVIVLGAGVNGTVPSLALRTRIDAAAAYLTANPDLPAVLSGGQGPGEDITEAEAMRRALTDKGIDPVRLLLEDRSTSTAENFTYSKALLEASGVDAESAVIAVVSNDFHLYRAEQIARSRGMNVVGVPARLPWAYLSINYYIREAFALANTLLFQL